MNLFTTICISAPGRLGWRVLGGPILLVLALVASVPSLNAAATLSVTPSTVSNLYAGAITLQIGGLTNGETVLVERFLDLNANGAIDAGEPLVQSFRLTDGHVTSIGGVRDGNIPGDNDLTANGQITATLYFANGPEFSRGSVGQIFRVSSPGGNFSAVQKTLTVTQATYAQQITGTVSNSLGTPLPFAMAAVLVQVGSDNQFIAGTAADAAGHFSLAVSNGTYAVIGFAPGYVGSFLTSPQVTVASANTNVGVALSAGTFTLSGTVADTGTGLGVPGAQFFVTSGNNEYFAVFSDALGNFSGAVINGQWKLDSSDYTLALGGWLRNQNKVQVTVSGASVSGVQIPATPSTALIYGTLKDDLNNPIGGVQLSGSDSGNLFQSTAYTDASGNYFLAVTNGTWYVGVGSKGSGLPNGLILQQAQVTIANGQAILTNLVARHASAYLVGVAKNSNNNPLGSGTIFAFANNGNQNISAPLASDGSFALPVWGGAWTISLENQTAASFNVVGPQLNFNVTDGVSISNINYVAPISTRTISGWVRTAASAPISGLNVFSGAFINGTNYNAGATTDGSGNYSLPVLAGAWNVDVDSQGLAQRGYGIVFGQTADTSTGNQTLNFVVGTPAVGTLFFRHALGVVGEFGNSSTPVVSYPVTVKNYRAIFHVFNDTNPPDASTVLFTGPPGSGLTNMPADPAFGAVQAGTDVFYFSPQVRSPSVASGGPWTVMYRTNANNLSVPDPQVFSRLLVPVPTVNVSGDLLRGLSWTYKDQNGNSVAGTPSFVVNNRVDLIDQNGNGVDAELFAATMSYSYPATNMYHWSGISIVRVDYYDSLTNQYFIAFSESSPSLTSAARLTGQRYEFQLNGPPGVNYTVQYKTNLTSGIWNTLVITNSPTSPIAVVDPSATNGSRFYRVLVGP